MKSIIDDIARRDVNMTKSMKKTIDETVLRMNGKHNKDSASISKQLKNLSEMVAQQQLDKNRKVDDQEQEKENVLDVVNYVDNTDKDKIDEEYKVLERTKVVSTSEQSTGMYAYE
jgi:translation initiation factor 2B subunit (eIF-2B alpha/beta/delta family)